MDPGRTIAALLLTLSAAAQAQLPAGGGPAPTPTDRMTDAERGRIWQAIDESRRDLVQRGLLPGDYGRAKGAQPLFQWPVAGVNGDPGVDAISNYVDLDPGFPDQLLDYDCGERSYDLDNGYNHRGIDIFTWPFPWLKMDHDEVEVRAAAAGRIIFRSDGNFDRSCAFGTGDWNAVYIEHPDGSVAWYGHLKDGSLTGKPLGSQVAAGERLGVIGSSGVSTGPHLHLETYNRFGQLVEPFAGRCNGLNAQSWWQDQPDYREHRINRIATGAAPPDFGTCPEQESPNEQTAFGGGETIYFATYYRDQLAGQESRYTIYRPDDTSFADWRHSSDEDFSASYWYWSYTLPERPQPGSWRFRVEFQGQIEELTFEVAVAVFDDGFEEIVR